MTSSYDTYLSFAEKLLSFATTNSDKIMPALEATTIDWTPYIYVASIAGFWVISFPVLLVVGVITMAYSLLFNIRWFTLIKILTSLSSAWNLILAILTAPLIASWFWVWMLDGLHFIDM